MIAQFPPSSPIKDKYLITINNLLSTNKLSFNAHAMLKDLINEREDIFFQSIMNPTDETGNSYTIDHLPEMLEGKLNRELEELFISCSYEEAKAASLSDRSTNNLTHKSLTYGEISFSSFLSIMNTLNDNLGGGIKGGTFYDLGSGSGRAIYTTRFSHDFDRCVGLELMGNLHSLAVSVGEKYDVSRYEKRLIFRDCECQFYNADILEYDWSDGDVVFAHSTCFGKTLLEAIFERSKMLKSGSILIMFSELPKGMDEFFELFLYSKEKMTWGTSEVFFLRRR